MLQDVWRPIRINIKFIWKSGRNEKRSRKVHLISDLPALDYSGGDLVRDERSLASHHLGRAWVVGERDKVVQVAHFSARLNLKQMRLKHCLIWICVERTCTG